jgi:hypothetical protein
VRRNVIERASKAKQTERWMIEKSIREESDGRADRSRIEKSSSSATSRMRSCVGFGGNAVLTLKTELVSSLMTISWCGA